MSAQENCALATIDGDKPARATRYVKTTGTARTLDETAQSRARKVVGLAGYVTNIPATVMHPSKVISNYHDLWHVEQSFPGLAFNRAASSREDQCVPPSRLGGGVNVAVTIAP